MDEKKIDPGLRALLKPARWYRYFRQDTHWVPNGRAPVLIADMDATWRYNCVRFLERNAARYARLYADGCSAEETVLALTHPDAPEEIGEMMWNIAAFAERDPLAWIRTTKLYQALAEGLPEKGQPLRKLAEKAKHWGGCEGRTRPKKGVCTCAELAARDQQERQEARRAAAEAMAEAATW